MTCVTCIALTDVSSVLPDIFKQLVSGTCLLFGFAIEWKLLTFILQAGGLVNPFICFHRTSLQMNLTMIVLNAQSNL